MQVELVLEIVQNNLNNVEHILNKHIVRGVYSYKGKPMSIYYIDHSEDEPTIEAIEKFQEDVVSIDYYNNSGSIQWNYYYIIIRNSINPQLKKAIEENDRFTRKHVFTIEEFANYFTYQKSAGEVKEDIVVQWKKKLKAKDFQFVYSNDPYTKEVEDYLSGKTLVEQEEKSTEYVLLKEDIIAHQHVKKIEMLDSYRPYPLERTFCFSKVNLIYGVNGSGKTSILEAIEYLFCGKSERYIQDTTPEGSLRIFFEGEILDEYTPGSNIKYRQRDKLWYNNTYSKGNNLYSGFNRYNYFNGDASYRMNDIDVNSYRKILETIILGPEYSFLLDRLYGFRSRFEERLRANRKKILESEQKLRELEIQINEYKRIVDEPEKILQKLQEILKKLNWKSLIYKIVDSNTLTFTEIQTVLKPLTDLRNLYGIDNRYRLNNEIKKYDYLYNQIIKLIDKKKQLDNQIREVERDKEILDGKMDVLNKLNIYLKLPNYKRIQNLSYQIDEVEHNLNLIRKIDQKYYQITWDLFQGNIASLEEIQNKISSELALAKQRLSEIEQKLLYYKNTIHESEQILAQIKALGNKFLHINPLAVECPLCLTRFESHELFNRINTVINNKVNSGELFDLLEKQGSVKAEIKNLMLKMEQLQMIEEIAILLYKNKSSSKETIIRILNDISTLDNRRKNLSMELSELLNFKKYLEEHSLSESDYSSLNKLIKQYFNYNLADVEKNSFDSLVNNVVNDRNEYDARIENLSASINILDSEIQDAFITNSNISINDDKYYHLEIEELTKKINYLGLCNYYYEELQKYMTISEMQSIVDIEHQINNAHNIFNTYRTTLANISQGNYLEKQIDNLKQYISSELVPERLKLDDVLSTINDLLDEEARNMFLKEFILQNEKQIINIMQRIHYPAEIVNISFFEKDEIELHRKNGEKCSIKQISSGQRTALALALFLTLNKKLKNGPAILMFDDPIVFVDDLNVLSFLDYLRELAINENKQIFFATAEQKIANYVNKKFSFLMEFGEYSEIKLVR